MGIGKLPLALLGVAALSAIGCNDTRRTTTAPTETPASSADRADRDDWIHDRDEYVARRERELDETDRRWESFKNTAGAKSRAAWNEVRKETSKLRSELRELRGSSRETWQESKRKIDAGWDRFEAKVRDAFRDNDRPNR